MTTVEALFEQFKKLPDWDRYPLPEAYYSRFNIKKPQPASVMEICSGYNPPPYRSLNENGKTEIRGPAPGGVREIKDLMTLPVEVNLIKDENQPEDAMEKLKTISLIPKDQIVSDSSPDSAPKTESLPKEDNKTKTQPSKDLLSQDLCDAFPYISDAVPYLQ